MNELLNKVLEEKNLMKDSQVLERMQVLKDELGEEEEETQDDKELIMNLIRQIELHENLPLDLQRVINKIKEEMQSAFVQKAVMEVVLDDSEEALLKEESEESEEIPPESPLKPFVEKLSILVT